MSSGIEIRTRKCATQQKENDAQKLHICKQFNWPWNDFKEEKTFCQTKTETQELQFAYNIIQYIRYA